MSLFVLTNRPRLDGPFHAVVRGRQVALLHNAGFAIAVVGDQEEDVAAFRKAVFLDPDQPVAWFQLGLALGSLQDQRGARRAYAAAGLVAIRFSHAQIRHDAARVADTLRSIAERCRLRIVGSPG